MGSLMAGWDSPIPDPKAVRYQRNWSFTKEEIDSYWRAKKKIEEEHLKAISSPSDSSQEKALIKEDSEGLRFQRSSSLPSANTKEQFMDNIMETDTSIEKFIQKHGWWKRSNWAHLNEPPVIGEGPAHKYTSQFHVAGLSASKADPRGGIVA